MVKLFLFEKLIHLSISFLSSGHPSLSLSLGDTGECPDKSLLGDANAHRAQPWQHLK